MVGAMCAAICPNGADLDFDLLSRILADLFKITVKSLTSMAESAEKRFRTAQVWSNNLLYF